MSSPNGNDETREPYDSQAVGRVRELLDAAPDRIGPYRLLERIGGGGMGEVYVAEQTAPIKRRVAVKIIKAGMDTRQVVARFEAERQALAMMDHPNIARVFDAGTTDAGRPYFVMELVRGVPITQFCDEARLSTRQRVELLVPVCQAVQHAHQKGIIHRDIKPTNVLVTLHDGTPVPKVIDFGIAKATSQPLTDMTVYTEFRQMIGTPAYMSPEQAEMSGLDIDTRSDIYSLGVLMYELLTGTTPFDATRLVKAGLMEVQRIIKEEDPPRPSVRISSLGQTLPAVAAQRAIEPARLGRIVAGELDWIVMKALEKDRRRRYETATGFATDLLRHLAGEPVHAAPPSWVYRARKFTRRYKAPVLTGGTLAVLLIAGVVATTLQWQRAESNAAAADAQRRSADTQRDAAELEAYVANLALCQTAIRAELWPESRQRLDACPESKRGWEWRFLRSRANAVRHSMQCNGEYGAISPDEKTLAITNTGDGSFRRWDALTGKPLGEAISEGGALGVRVMAIRFADDGESMITLSRYRETVWNSKTDKRLKITDLAELPEPSGDDVTSPDNRIRATFEKDGVRLTSSSEPAASRFLAHPNAGYVSFSPDSTQLITSTSSGEAKLWEAASGRCLGVASHRFRDGLRGRYIWFPSQRSVLALSEAADGGGYREEQSIVVDLANFDDSIVRVNGWSESKVALEALRPPGQNPATQTSSRRPAITSAESPDGRSRVTWSERAIRFAERDSGRELLSVPFEGTVREMFFTTDGTRLVIATDYGVAEVWDTREAAARQADRDQMFALIPRAEERVRRMLVSERVVGDLYREAADDRAMQPLEKLAVFERLKLQLSEIDQLAERTFHSIRKDSTSKSEAFAAAREIVSWRLRENVIGRIRATSQENEQQWPIWFAYRLKDPGLDQRTRERLLAVCETFGTGGTGRSVSESVYLACAQLRVDRPEAALMTLANLDAFPDIDDDNLEWMWGIRAMAHHRLGHESEARSALRSAIEVGGDRSETLTDEAAGMIDASSTQPTTKATTLPASTIE